jgi:hypothetical protein
MISNVGLKREGSLLLIKANGSEKKIDAAIDMGCCLTEKVIRRPKLEKLSRKEKHGAIFVILKTNLVSNKMLRDTKTTRSDAYFRFMVAAGADLLPPPANIQQSYQRPRTIYRRCDKSTERTFVQVLKRSLAM